MSRNYHVLAASVTLGLSAACLFGLVFWCAFDASFLYLVKANCGRIGFGPLAGWYQVNTPAHPARANFVALGFGVAVFWLINAAAMVVWRPTRNHSILLLLMLVAWGVFIPNVGRLSHWGSARRVRGLIPQLSETSALLYAKWPDDSGMLPIGFRFTRSDKYPSILVVENNAPRFPFREIIGPEIEKSSDGAIRFQLEGAVDSVLEFRPDGPSAFLRPTEYGYQRVNYEEIAAQWFLVRYE